MSSGIDNLARAGGEIESIPVHINFDIIRLFSEGLYRSPHKAIEELVSNAYDAEARRVHVLLPEQPDDPTAALAPLWVIDDGHGMDAEGFRQLWRVAESNKSGSSASNGRAPIGQFGIGKLAAYVLAWKLTHLSRVDDKLLLTVMDFRAVTGRQAQDNDPVRISLRRVDEDTARQCLADIKHRDPSAWKLMFDGRKRSRRWTAAGMSDFKDLYGKLSTGTLRWVLSTGLPLHGDFKIRLNGERVASSKERLPEIKSIVLDDELPGIGKITGTARIFQKQLTKGKSEQAGRSHGFFIRVRGRVINLEDELFGVEALNHAAWSRFALKINADGLRDHLLSSREGVRDSEEIGEFRQYLRKTFNRCRAAYEEWERSQNNQLDLVSLLSDDPSPRVTEPLLRGVRKTVETGSESFYIKAPKGVDDENILEWLAAYEDEASEKPFDRTEFLSDGPHAPAIRYDPSTRRLVVNRDHPFVDKLTGGDKHRNPATLFASSEVLLECQLQDQGIDRGTVADVLRDRDEVLRLTAGDAPHTAAEVLRLLQAANQDRNALERATGVAFRVLGFKYERRGGAASGPDGILFARLGRHKTLADYKVVYDAKQTREPAVPADKIDFASLEDFRRTEQADFGFFIATAYASEMEPAGALNRRIEGVTPCLTTLLKIEHLRRLVWLHYKFGVTLTELRSLFEKAHTVREVDDWIEEREQALHEQVVPLRVLLEELESEKSDRKAVPNVKVVRSKHPELKKFEPERLIARLKAVETILDPRWIDVDTTSYDVLMHHTADQLLARFEDCFNELYGEAD